LDEGEIPPPLDKFDALRVMGVGRPMDAWQEGKHPRLRREIELIKEAVELRACRF
jgi:hypothetical protein